MGLAKVTKDCALVTEKSPVVSDAVFLAPVNEIARLPDTPAKSNAPPAH
jgi:hypothetical protein